MIKWLLPVCIFFLACRQTTKTGSGPILRSTGTTKQQNPDTGLAPQSTTDLPSDQLIVPGESIGKTHLGMEASRLEQLLGKPDISDAAMGKAWLTWKGQGDHNNALELNIYTSYKDSTMQKKTVQQIRTTSPFFSTAGGGRVHDPLASLRRFYPGLKKAAHYSAGGKTIFVYDEQAEGIAFEIAASGDQENCTGIIVHKKGTGVMDVYLALHPDAKRY